MCEHVSYFPPRRPHPHRRRPRRRGPGSGAEGRRPARRRAVLGRGSQPARPKGATLPAAGQAPHFPVHERRAVARRHVRSQARSCTSTPARGCPIRESRRPETPRRKDPPLALQAPQTRPIRHRGDRPVPRNGRAHRRHLCHPLDAHRHREPRARPLVHEQRQHAADPAQHGLLADLRTRLRKPKPARLHRAVPRQARRWPAVVEQQFSARHLPRHAHQQLVDRPPQDHPQRSQRIPFERRAAPAARFAAGR